MKRLITAAAWIVLVPGALAAQTGDAALRDRVSRFVEKLAAPAADERDAAEQSLIKFGPKALPFLNDPKGASEDLRKRLEKIRAALQEEQEKQSLSASRVTLQGKGIRLSEAIKQLQVQTGNRITDLRDEPSNPALDLDIVDKPFLEALDLVTDQAKVGLNFFTGDGTIGLMTGGEGEDLPDMIGVDPPKKPVRVLYSGPFRIIFKAFATSVDFSSGQSTANAQFEVAWEPRIRPMLLALKASELKIIDDLGEVIAPSVTDESSSVVLRPENPVAEININMDAPQSGAKALKSMVIKAEVTTPAGVRTFKFPSLAARDVTLKQGDIAVHLGSTEIEEQTWKVDMTLSMPGEGPAFESYRQGLFNNRIWLQKADGSRFEQNGGFSNTGSDGGKLGFEYIFVDAPGKPADYSLIYETPSRVLPIPLEFEFKDVPIRTLK